MALTREDAGKIGKEAAEKVIKSAQACRCGIVTWDTRSIIGSVEADVAAQSSTAALSDIGLLGRALKVVEEDCGINVSEAGEIAQRMDASVEKKEWQEARHNAELLKSSIFVSLKEGAKAPLAKESVKYAPYIHETKRIGEKVIKKYSVASTDLIIYEAWEPSALMGPHATITSIDNTWYGLVGTKKPSPELEALPPMSEERIRAVGKWYENQYEEAYRLIIQAFPEAKDGRRSAGVFFVHWSEIQTKE